VKALDPANSTVLVRDESDWPREFRMTDEARIKLYGVKKTGKQDEDV
jgi:hypothetical protein